VDAPGQTVFAKKIQIPPDGLGGDLKMARQIFHTDDVRLVKHFSNMRLAL
jgi:hypothetical protein